MIRGGGRREKVEKKVGARSITHSEQIDDNGVSVYIHCTRLHIGSRQIFELLRNEITKFAKFIQF